ncbi:MAG TPA: pyrroline-5-carboxylate reductase [Rhizomicrobium sp.]|jgi:pyrroline-5-carboxylate reductase|nr:pyrroline-5-carboxylate reductase [Rhizomicrobium sp.]
MSGSPLLLIGAGRMGGALLKGWIAGKAGPIVVVEPKPSPALKTLARKKAITLAPALSKVTAKKFSACLVALKPQILKTEAPLLAHVAQGGALMISVAAGTHTDLLFPAWGKNSRIIRAMPNTPGAIGQGITGLYAASGATAADKRKAVQLLSALGETVWVDKEDLIDSVTALSGSGPAYLFLMAEAMTEAGVAEGLPREQAEKLARATVAGAGALLKADKSPASALREAVTSPGGTTAAALSVLMAKDGLTDLMARAIHAARKRAEELR